VDKYRLYALVGVGGMGAVYCGNHLGLDRRVAVKILLPHLAIAKSVVIDLFEREAKMVSGLLHENIVLVTDAGRTPEDLAYIVMEWLEGHTLEDELSTRKPASLERSSLIIRQIAAALNEAHVNHIIHRDLKPSNVMLVKRLDGREQVKVLDFGIAKVISDTAGSLVSQALGTPHYASPEQFRQGGRIDNRADIYSLGVILYQMLTGELPFNASSVHEMIRQHLTEQPPSVRTLRPEIPEAVEQLVSRMLAKEPIMRPGSASEVSDSLELALNRPNKTQAETLVDIEPATENGTEQSNDTLSSLDRAAIRDIIQDALNSIDAKEHGSWGSFYILDNNSRRVFGKLKSKFDEKSTENVINELVSFLDDKESLTRWKAMRLLIYYGYSDSKRIRRLWEDESGWMERKIVLETLKNLPEKDSFNLLIDVATMDDNHSIRGAALEKLQSYSDEHNRQQIVTTLLEALFDDHSSVRGTALNCLLAMRVEEAIEKAPNLLLKDQDNFVRVAAGDLLGEMGSIESFESLTTAFARKAINDYAFKGCVSRYERRFGKRALLDQAAKMKDLSVKAEVEAILNQEK